ncbi:MULTISPECIES: bacterio-opsin activator domain-containing protein [unclassified Halorubrum]|uniref:bacterio-opsin activator domain-containing protein n=1 Tax=unclassified Halorubrum TaxID=2642239 RepID=UPI000EF188B0|nr:MULTISPECIES: bacterio-opsin activator domain-containing protein [unclassified Halorubrum]RLM52453.1 PAS domain-containing protein [Halorubrum sp. Atlit-28R]TKX44256.1 PAS domain-containing protein [Halorubrum sp. ARQ200]TKX63591.1 PAS domain-containing protein [Halorubrum sp. ASP1]
MANARALLVHPEEGSDRIETALGAAGFDVTRTDTAASAVAKATTGEYDCVVSEYALAGDDGVALATAIEESDAGVPVVMFTATDEEGVPEAAFENGVDRFLQKNGSASIDRLVSDVSTVCSGVSASETRQDVSDHEPTASEVTRAVEDAPIGISISDPDLPDYPLVYVNDAWEEHTGYPVEEALGRNPRFLQGPGTDPETVDEIAEAIGNEEEVTVEIRNYRRDGTPFWNELTVAPVYDEDGDLAHYVGFQNDISDRKEAERLAEERAEKLATERRSLDRVLGRVNGLLSDISRILVENRDSGVISERVCEVIAGEPGYAGGWIGEVSSATGRLEIRAASGVSVEPGASYDVAETPAEVQEAIETEELHSGSIDDAADGPLEPKSAGGRRLLVVPLTYGDRQYGLLGIYGNGADVLARRERRVCESVGKMIANGLHSIETTEILTTDRVVELVVGIRDETAALARIADAVGGEVVHLGTTRLEDDECELYFRADGEGLDLDELASLPLVESMRTVSETNDGVSFAVTVTDSPPLTQLAAHGGVVTEATATGDEATLTIEAPPEHDVRSILDVFRDEYEGVELRSRVERESRDRTVAEFAAAVDERLTDRQRDALKTAELNGYFEWPRPVDGSEIADRMGITRQTFHQHLRAAERKLVEAYVDPRSDG